MKNPIVIRGKENFPFSKVLHANCGSRIIPNFEIKILLDFTGKFTGYIIYMDSAIKDE